MSDFIRPGEALRSGDSERDHAKSIHARIIAIVTNADPQPAPRLLTSREVMAFLLNRAGVPHLYIGAFLRLGDDGIAAALGAVDKFRSVRALAAWLDGLAAAAPNFNDARE